MTSERIAQIRRTVDTIEHPREVIREVLAEVEEIQRDRDSARRELAAAYTILIDAVSGRPATVKAAAQKAAKMIRDHDAERRRVLTELAQARERTQAAQATSPSPDALLEDDPREPVLEEGLQDGRADDWENERTPLATYMDAVVDALMGAGVGVRDHHADTNVPTVYIELDPVSAARQPIMNWEPTTGWSIAMLYPREARPATVHYVGITAIPTPATVATAVLRWRTTPDHLPRVEPSFGPISRGDLDRMLTGAAR